MTDKQRIKQLEVSLLMYERSPFYGGYIAILKQITQWNNEMSIKPIKLAAVEDDDMRAFDKAMKFLEKQKQLYETLDFLRGKMTLEEKDGIDKLEVNKNSVEDFLLGENN